MTRTLEARDLAVDIGKRRLLSGLDFTAEPGSLIAVVGINGIGKSTLMRVLAGIVAPAEGRVLLDGRDIRMLAPRRRARAIAFAGQDERPPGELSAAEFVALGRLPHTGMWGMGGRAEHDAVASALDTMGVGDLADEMCDRLSGGQVRRIVLARALAQEAGVLLLDEPTNHLDVHHQHHLLEILRSTGKTVIANIHDLDLAMAYFDRVVMLHDGGARTVGEPGHVFVEDAVAEAFGVGGFQVHDDRASRPHLIIESL